MENRNGNKIRMYFRGKAALDLQSFAEHLADECLYVLEILGKVYHHDALILVEKLTLLQNRARAYIGDLFMNLIHTCALAKINPFEYLTVLQNV